MTSTTQHSATVGIKEGFRLKRSGARGIAVFSTVALLGASLVYTSLGAVIKAILASLLDDTHSIAISLHTICYTLLLVLCVIGLIAVGRYQSGLQSFFCAALIGHLILAIGSGVFCLILLFRTRDRPTALAEAKNCLAAIQSMNTFAVSFCHRDATAKGMIASSLVGMWCLEAVTFFAVNASIMETQRCFMVDEEDPDEEDEYEY